MSNESWELIPHQGIEKNGTQVFFGTERSVLHSMLGAHFAPPKSFQSDEDDYEAEDGTWIRLRFAGTQLRDIEFLGGSLLLNGLELHQGAHWASLQPALAAQGYAFRETEWLGEGFDFETLGINLATHEQLGGDEDDDGIEWVITSSDWAT